MSVMHYYFN